MRDREGSGNHVMSMEQLPTGSAQYPRLWHREHIHAVTRDYRRPGLKACVSPRKVLLRYEEHVTGPDKRDPKWAMRII